LYRSSYALVASALGTSLLGVVFWALAARSYSASTLGIQSAILSASFFLSAISRAAINDSLVRFIPVAGSSTKPLISTSYAVSLVLGGSVAAVFLLGIRLWSPELEFLRDDPGWFVAFTLLTALTCVFFLQDGVLIGMRRSVWLPLENALMGGVKLGLLPVFAIIAPSVGIFASWNAPIPLAVLIVNLIIYLRLAPGHRDASNGFGPLKPRQVIRYALGNFIGSAILLGSVYLMPVLVLNRAGTEATAYFFLPWTIFLALQAIPTSTSFALTVEGVVDPGKISAYCRRALFHGLALVAPAVVVLAVGASRFLDIFGGDYSREGSELLRWLALAALPSVIVAVGLAFVRIQARSFMVAVINGALFSSLFCSSYLLVPHHGIRAIGIAAFVSESAVALVMSATLLRPVLRPPLRVLDEPISSA
jgi:O-antigen/teichoic acid export membrane protein